MPQPDIDVGGWSWSLGNAAPAVANQGEHWSAGSPTLQDAEALLDQAGERFGRFLSFAGLQALRAAALAREEIEDFWAEVRAIRRGDRSSPE